MTNGKVRGWVCMALALRATFAFNWRARVVRKSMCVLAIVNDIRRSPANSEQPGLVMLLRSLP